MGTYYSPGSTKASLIQEILNDYKPDRVEILRHTCVGNHLWVVLRDKAAMTLDAQAPVIHLFLLTNGGKSSGWGYKPLEEAMHPYYYSCPLKYLELAPVLSQAWRDGVAAYHARRATKVTLGATYSVTGAWWKLAGRPITTVVVQTLRPLTALVNGSPCKIPRKMLADLTLAAAPDTTHLKGAYHG